MYKSISIQRRNSKFCITIIWYHLKTLKCLQINISSNMVIPHLMQFIIKNKERLLNNKMHIKRS
jgi:hypothetical protein